MDKINPVKSPRARAQECCILKASSCPLSGSHEQPQPFLTKMWEPEMEQDPRVLASSMSSACPLSVEKL